MDCAAILSAGCTATKLHYYTVLQHAAYVRPRTHCVHAHTAGWRISPHPYMHEVIVDRTPATLGAVLRVLARCPSRHQQPPLGLPPLRQTATAAPGASGVSGPRLAEAFIASRRSRSVLVLLPLTALPDFCWRGRRQCTANERALYLPAAPQLSCMRCYTTTTYYCHLHTHARTARVLAGRADPPALAVTPPPHPLHTQRSPAYAE